MGTDLPVLIYDGDCGFCTSSAAWIRNRLPDDASVAPWQETDIEALGLSEHDVTSAAWWIDPDGSLHRGHASIGKSLVAAGGVWKPVGWLILHPPVAWLARPVYALVARYRYKLPGSTDACRIT